jgi:hypothetical protein
MIQIIVHYPQTLENQQELEKRVAIVHAQSVSKYIERLTCPTKQKAMLFDEIINRKTAEC